MKQDGPADFESVLAEEQALGGMPPKGRALGLAFSGGGYIGAWLSLFIRRHAGGSDGGHFENLGVYELVRRRCALILASDAGADPKYTFEDLAGMRRKCYTDFGVEFDFSGGKVDDIRPQGEQPGARHYALARILYPGGAPAGTLIYWKSSLSADLPPDIMHYRRTMQDFPHETTADQFFDEAQFESYRHLGYEVAMRSIKAMQAEGKLPAALS